MSKSLKDLTLKSKFRLKGLLGLRCEIEKTSKNKDTGVQNVMV